MEPNVRTLLKREESCAVHALLYLHEFPGASAAQVAADLQTPAAFTAKVLRRLGATGLVEARPAGRAGCTCACRWATCRSSTSWKPCPGRW